MVLGEGQQNTCGTTKLGKKKVDTPDFFLTTQAVLAAEFEFTVETFTFERTAGVLADPVAVAVVAHGWEYGLKMGENIVLRKIKM